MSIEETKPSDGEVTNNQQSTGESASQPQTTNQSGMAGGAQAAQAAPSKAPAATEEAEKPAIGDEDEEESASDFGAILDKYEQEKSGFHEGDVVKGRVVGITERGVVIDFGYKSEGIVNQAEFTEKGQLTVKPGDEVEVLVKSMETSEGFPVLSRADAVRMKAWDELERAYSTGATVRGRVTDRIKGGLRVDIDGIAAFLPGSQVDT
nr:S1 RNA-binding domain-containing protein [Acidobacteriota bacterium]